MSELVALVWWAQTLIVLFILCFIVVFVGAFFTKG